jgi:hypothetical protein
MSTSATFLKLGEFPLPEALAQLRRHAAIVRTLVDQIDRLAPPSARSTEAARFTAVSAQLAEEFQRLGCRILECAAAMAGVCSETARDR